METRFPTLKGLRRAAQGCRLGLPWENGDKISNPEGVASSSPGLPSAATLGKWRQDFQPRRGRVEQPTAAVTRDPRFRPPTSTAVHRLSPRAPRHPACLPTHTPPAPT